MKALTVSVFVAGLLSLGAPVAGAPITWQTPVNETGNVLDIVTAGTFFDSMVGQSVDRTVGGVTFNRWATFSAGTATYANGSQITLNNIANPSYFTSPIAPLPSGWDANYLAMVGSQTAAVDGGEGGEIRLNGLTVGNDYLVQIFMPIWDANWRTRFRGDTGSYSSYLDVAAWGGPFGTPAVPQYVIGTFTADTASQSIFFEGQCCATQIAGLQVRSLEEVAPVPEPTTLLFLGTGLAGLVVLRRRQGQ